MIKVVIIAGGKGTRISRIAPEIPKPMIPVYGKPVLEWEIENLRRQGFTDIIITVGHLGTVIMDYFGDGSRFGVQIQYFEEKKPLGNAGALLQIRDVFTEDFFLINGDLICDVDLSRMLRFHQEHKALATLFTHPNNHPYDSSLIISDSNSCVIGWITREEKRAEYVKNRVNAGIHIINPVILDTVTIDRNLIGSVDPITGKRIQVDLDRQLLYPLVQTGKMFAYDSPEYVKDMGTPERLIMVERDLEKKMPRKRNLLNKQKAIFLDRDGVINKYLGFLTNINDFELLPGVAKAIKIINELGYLCIVVTNQPVIARGEMTWEGLDAIHNKMETLLGYEGAYIDKIYFCPHHPDRGYPGEVSALKVVCDCRKPKPGLLLRAAQDFNIDFRNSWMIGDSENDILAGNAVGCKSVLIKDALEIEEKSNFGQIDTLHSLFEFVSKYLKEELI